VLQGLLMGAGMSSDAHHLAVPDPAGSQSSIAMKKALGSAGCAPGDVQFISAHATGTGLGDLAESKAIHQVFGGAASEVWVTAPKASLGHLLGAAGAVESILTIKALQSQVVPQSLNCDPIDPEIQLRVSFSQAISLQPQRRHMALKNTFGFGGHNVSLLWASST